MNQFGTVNSAIIDVRLNEEVEIHLVVKLFKKQFLIKLGFLHQKNYIRPKLKEECSYLDAQPKELKANDLKLSQRFDVDYIN